MEVNKLNTPEKKMAKKAGLDNSHLTNHSVQKQIIQTKQSRARSFGKN